MADQQATILRNISPNDVSATVWRYMPFAKFISLLTYQSLWFSKLSILQDQFEGMIPSVTKVRMNQEHQRWKEHFRSSHLHAMIDDMTSDNERSGRELLVVNCWFMGDDECARMWREYAPSKESIAIKSSIDRLQRSVALSADPVVSQIGKVTYVDHANHDMPSRMANAANERAFLKDKRFEHENELRLVTFNCRTTNCVDANGVRYTREQVDGPGMNNRDADGLYVLVNIDTLFSHVVVAPNADAWFFRLVSRIVQLYGISATVSRSKVAAA